MKHDKHIIDLRPTEAHKTLDQVQADTPLEFTPDETPDKARHWLAQQRFERDAEQRRLEAESIRA
jgi:hypothetical protein